MGFWFPNSWFANCSYQNITFSVSLSQVISLTPYPFHGWMPLEVPNPSRFLMISKATGLPWEFPWNPWKKSQMSNLTKRNHISVSSIYIDTQLCSSTPGRLWLRFRFIHIRHPKSYLLLMLRHGCRIRQGYTSLDPQLIRHNGTNRSQVLCCSVPWHWKVG